MYKNKPTLEEIKQGITEALQEFNIINNKGKYYKEKYSKCFETVIDAICESNNKIKNPRSYAKSVSIRAIEKDGLRIRYTYTSNYRHYR